ncbi:MAG: carboxylesterase family protein [Verrucomicrobia bacterium]|nr:carboxylesterase family protein [Verrucomicrobiota bacterium]
MKTTIISLSVILAALTLWAQESPRPASSGSLAGRFKQLDRNGDGKLTRDEIPRLFDQLDKNKDGVVTREEAQAGMAQRRPQSTTQPATPSSPATELVRKLDVRYATMNGVEAKSQSLDVYAPKDAKNAPVIIFIHGGGWRNGDKSNPGVGSQPAAHFCAHGFVFVSINYRLTPEGKHPANIQDVAKAVAWVHNHIAEHGGDPSQINIMGHSAGAHLAALIATDESRLKAEGKPLRILKRAILLDTAAYDIPRFIKEFASDRQGAGMKSLYTNAFGDTEEQWRDASPQAHVASGKDIPPMLLFFTGSRMAANALAPAFAEALTKAGAPSRAVDTITLTHSEIGMKAADKDHPLGQLVLRFLKGEDVTKIPAKLDAKAAPVSVPPSARVAGDTAFGVSFAKDYFPGTKDRHGQFMGGTETMRLAAHDGKLFAALGYWTDQPGGDPQPGAQILVKRGPDAAWEVDRNFPGALRVNCMEPVTFTTDGVGKKLAQPVELLLADAGLNEAHNRGGPLSVWVRDDDNQQWVESRVADSSKRAYIRAFGQQRDTVTGVDHVFAGTGAGEVFSGVFDPTAPGRIRWNPKPEYANPDFDGGAFRRCQGFCVASGKAYASISPSLVERKDGPNPVWHEVFRWKPTGDRAGQGLRGITAVPDPKGGKHEIILGSREQEGRILRIDPANNYAVELELQSDAFLKDKLDGFRGGKLVAYNRFEPGTDPRTGKPIHWVTVAGVKPDDMQAAWLMVRHADATHEPVRVFDAKLNPHPLLFSTRTLEFAPWNPREFYTGGYDGAANNRSNHNTAWIYKATLEENP